jgi:hypothetical protein
MVEYKIHLNELMRELAKTSKNLWKLSSEKVNIDGAKLPPLFAMSATLYSPFPKP